GTKAMKDKMITIDEVKNCLDDLDETVNSQKQVGKVLGSGSVTSPFSRYGFYPLPTISTIIRNQEENGLLLVGSLEQHRIAAERNISLRNIWVNLQVGSDKWIWEGSSDGSFSVASYKEMAVKDKGLHRDSLMRWIEWIPIKKKTYLNQILIRGFKALRLFKHIREMKIKVWMASKLLVSLLVEVKREERLGYLETRLDELMNSSSIRRAFGGIRIFSVMVQGRSHNKSNSVDVDLLSILCRVSVMQIKMELATMKLLRHPNVVRLYEYPFRHKLRSRVEHGRMHEEEARYYFQQLINAVEYCHCRGIHHRDLK
ncbi:hypothetical protein M8C21_021281, partial [Ambrosia artemisiifolia]